MNDVDATRSGLEPGDVSALRNWASFHGPDFPFTADRILRVLAELDRLRGPEQGRLMAEAPTMLDLLRGLAEVHARWQADAGRSAGDLLAIARAAAVEAREIIRRVDGGAQPEEHR